MTLWRYSFSAFYLLILYPFRVHLIFNLHGPCKWNSKGDEKIAQNWDSLDFGERSCSVTTRVRWVTGNDPKNEKRNDAWIHIQYCTVYLGGIIIYHFVSSKCKQRYFFSGESGKNKYFWNAVLSSQSWGLTSSKCNVVCTDFVLQERAKKHTSPGSMWWGLNKGP